MGKFAFESLRALTPPIELTKYRFRIYSRRYLHEIKRLQIEIKLMGILNVI